MCDDGGTDSQDTNESENDDEMPTQVDDDAANGIGARISI